MQNFLVYLVALILPATVLAQLPDTSMLQPNNLIISLNVMPAKSAMLSWRNDSEITNGFFVVERRSDTGSFEPMASVKVSAESFEYKIADEKPFPGINHYRIKMVAPERNPTYSPVVTGDMSLVSFCRFYPNPADDHLIISALKPVEIKVFSRSGLISLSKNLEKGLTAIDLTSLPKGVYVLMVISTDTKTTMREILYKN